MQRWFAERSWLLLGLLSTACARPQYIANFHGVSAGPYKIYNCGTNTETVSDLVNTLMNTLQVVLNDLSERPSGDAYTTFFKHIAFAPFVHDILSNITTGAPFPPGPHANRHASPELFGSPRTPQFVCVTDYNQITWLAEAGGGGLTHVDAHTVCRSNPVPAFSLFGSKQLKNSIVLCPFLFTYASIPSQSVSNCLKEDSHFNQFKETGGRMILYQLWILLDELAHSYIYAATGALTPIWTANECASLAASDAAKNAMSYVYYTANVHFGCTNFPRADRPGYSGTAPTHGTGLLEIDANTTLSGGSESTSMFTSEGQSAGNSSTGSNRDLPNGIALTPWPT